MPSTLLTVRAGEAAESGLFPGVHPLDVPLWEDGRNVVFRDGGPQKIPGWTSPAIVTGAGIIRGADANQKEDLTQVLYMGDATKLYSWDASTVTEEGSGYTGQVNEDSSADATAWSFARFGNFMIATNGVDEPQIDKGSGFVDLGTAPDVPTRGQIAIKRGPHILLFNTNNGPNVYDWCDEDDPEDWEITQTNAAGSQNIRDMDGEIKAACPFGEYIAVVGKNQLYLVSYTGSPFYFPYKPALSGIGAVGKMAIIEADRMLYGYGQGGIWRSDGVSFEYIDNPAIREWIQSQIDTTQLSKIVATHDSYNQTVWFFCPTTATKENTFGVGYRYATGSWTIVDFGRSACVPQLGVYKQPVWIGTDDRIYFHNNGLTANGSAITAYVQTKPMDMQRPEMIKTITNLMVQMRRLAGTVQVRIGSQYNLDDAVTWSDYQTLDDGFEALPFLLSGRFITIEVRSSTTNADWAMSGFTIYGDLTGAVL